MPAGGHRPRRHYFISLVPLVVYPGLFCEIHAPSILVAVARHGKAKLAFGRGQKKQNLTSCVLILGWRFSVVATDPVVLAQWFAALLHVCV